ncbi:MAG: hypothetical protein ACYS8Z_09815 [Planctomycetota bacterium]
MKYPPIVAILLSCIICTATEATETPGSTVLSVEVVNGTSEGKTVEGDDVKVFIYKDEKVDKVISGNVKNGRAVFENVPTGDNIMAVPNAKHDDMAFSGEAVALGTGSATVSAKVQVYDVSTDTSKISVGTHHFFVNAQAHRLVITEYVELMNNTDTAITSAVKDRGEKPVVVKIPLPEGFRNLSSSSYFVMKALKVTDEGFYDTMAVPPGKYQTAFSYSLAIDSETMEITKQISMPTSEFKVFSQLPPGRIQGLGKAQGRVTLGDGSTAEYYKPAKYKAKDTVSFQVTGLDVGESVPYIAISVMAIFAIIGILKIAHSVRKRIRQSGP